VALVSVKEEIAKSHGRHHMGVDRTLYVVKRCCPNECVTREDVAEEVRCCQRCKEIDPAPVQWEKGELEVAEVWERVACDVTHYENQRYFTMIDCGPSRFAIWRHIEEESASTIVKIVKQIFLERGPPVEMLLDNAKTFHSQQFLDLCKAWGVRVIFRCAYRPEGNGIIERNHRTIKRMAARTRGDVAEMVYWYNSTPVCGLKDSEVPSGRVYTYPWRFPQEAGKMEEERGNGLFSVGEEVLVRPGEARCTSKWQRGVVTHPGNAVSVEVGGVLRHVSHVRRIGGCEQMNLDGVLGYQQPGVSVANDAVQGASTIIPVSPSSSTRPTRNRRRPMWLDDYVVDDEDITGRCS
jgi:hypothetical protein